jgi:2-polyprenyl-6-methoxyphenol hydroxylase-like FAD-dependent oxidoreductase
MSCCESLAATQYPAGIRIGPERIEHREYVATTPHHTPFLTFYHPEMQEVMLQAAAAAGAEVRWGAVVREVKPGAQPIVVVEHDGERAEVRAQLVVGTDGRASLLRMEPGCRTCMSLGQRYQ